VGPTVESSNQFLQGLEALYELESVIEVDLLVPDFGLISNREAISDIWILPN